MERDDSMFKKKYNKELVSSTLNMAIPAIIESFFIAFVSLVDSFMVSSLGSSAVASVGLTSQPRILALTVFTATNVALSALVARRLGENDRRGANGILCTAIALICIVTAVITVLTYTFASPILKFCGTTEDTHSMAMAYYRIIMCGTIFTVCRPG